MYSEAFRNSYTFRDETYISSSGGEVFTSNGLYFLEFKEFTLRSFNTREAGLRVIPGDEGARAFIISLDEIQLILSV